MNWHKLEAEIEAILTLDGNHIYKGENGDTFVTLSSPTQNISLLAQELADRLKSTAVQVKS